MFYLVPNLNFCSTPQNSPEKTEKKWSKLDTTGLSLDIVLIAALCIAATIGLCIRFGVPLGPLNHLPALNALNHVYVMSILWTAAGAWITADLAKIIYKNCSKSSSKAQTIEESTTETEDSTIGSDSDEEILPHINSPSAHHSPEQSGDESSVHPSPVQSDDETLPEEPAESDGQSNENILPHIDSNIRYSSEQSGDETNETTESEAESNENILPHLQSLSSRGSDNSSVILDHEPPHIAVRKIPQFDFTEISQPLIDDDFVEMNVSDEDMPPPIAKTWFQTITDIARWAANGVYNTLLSAFDYFSTFLKPGEIQMRFYTHQISFLIDQLLSFNENTLCFDAVALPVSYDAKIKKLKAKNFQDPDIAAFKQCYLATLEAKRGLPYAIRYDLLCHIEAAFERNDVSPAFHLFIQQLCYKLYTDFDGISYGHAVVDAQLNQQPLEFKNLAETLENDQRYMNQLPEAIRGTKLHDVKGRIQGATGLVFYPMLTNNFASKLWEEVYQEGHRVKIIRFGSPTSQYVGPAAVLGQMELFLRECTRRKETLLSFQHQSFQGESPRLQAMLDLATKYPSSFYFLNMDMDSDFYHQKEDIYTENVHRDVFKIRVVDHVEKFIMSENLSAKIRNRTFRTDLEKIAEDVLAYFPKQSKLLTLEERKDFIFLYYVRYRQYLHAKIAPTYSCSQCKDTMDRSMSVIATAFLCQAIDLNQHENPSALKFFRTLVDFVGIIVKGSPMHHGRFKRFLPVIKRLTALQQKPNIKSTLASQDMAGTTFNHTYTPFPCDAPDLQTYSTCTLMQPTHAPIPVVAVDADTPIPLLVQKLYQNNQLNCRIQFADNQFTVFYGNNVRKGTFSVIDGYLCIQIMR